MAKLETLISEVAAEISRGVYGGPGDKFITIREMCVKKDISLKTSFLLFAALRDIGAIEKRRKSYFILGGLQRPGITKQKPLIGCVVTALESPYFSKLVRYIEEAVSQYGASLLIASSEYNFERERARITGFLEHGAAGLLICPWASEEEESFYRNIDVPVVMIGHKPKSVAVDAVMVNNQTAAQMVAGHLMARGCKNFAYIGQRGVQRDERLFGFRSQLYAHGITLNDNDIVITDYANQEQCDRDIVQLLVNRRPGTGIFCYHDLFAARVIMHCHKLNIDVPGDIRVVGFDDLPMASELSPALTTVRYPIEAMARIASEMLYARMMLENAAEPAYSYLDSELVERETT